MESCRWKSAEKLGIPTDGRVRTVTTFIACRPRSCGPSWNGSFARFLRRMRGIYAERHALLSEGLLRIAPDLLRPIPSFSGLHLTTLLTENIEESEMRERALATHYRA